MANLLDITTGFYASSFGTVRIFCSRLSTTEGRNLVVHEMSGGANHVVQDMGARVVVASATLLFDYMNGDTVSPKARLEEFRALVGTEQVLTHPLNGSYNARVGPFTPEVDEHGSITATVEFTATQIVNDVVPAGAASIPASGEGAVEAAATLMRTELAELELSDDGLSASAEASVNGWNMAETSDPRVVLADTGTYTEKLGRQADTLSGDLDKYSAFKATVLFADAVRSAAAAVSSGIDQTFVYRVAVPTALRTILAAEFGAEAVDYFYGLTMKLNDIVTPGLLPEGTTLALPFASSAVRNG